MSLGAASTSVASPSVRRTRSAHPSAAPAISSAPRAAAANATPSITSTPATTSTATADRANAPARPTPVTAAETRRRVANDAAAQQLRARTETRAIGLGVIGLGASAESAPRGFDRNADGSYTFRGTSGADRLAISQTSNGDVRVRDQNSGRSYELTRAQAERGLTIEAGAGDDRVVVRDGVTSALTIRGGEGHDRLDGRASGGRLSIEGGAGDDVLLGGRGHDQLFGDDGADRIEAGAGDDFVHSGTGADRVDGGIGSDAIYADGDDRADAGADQDLDVIIGADPSGRVENLGDRDRRYSFDPAAVDAYLAEHPELRISGRASFVDRTRADLGVMLQTEQGRGLLGDLSRGLRERCQTLTLDERTAEAGGSYLPATNRTTVGQWVGRYPDGANQMPLPVLFHELAHAQQDLVRGATEGSSSFSGRLIPNAERQATGLPLLDSTLGPGDALPYTDNAFRRELRLVERTTYSGESGAPTGYARRQG